MQLAVVEPALEQQAAFVIADDRGRAALPVRLAMAVVSLLDNSAGAEAGGDPCRAVSPVAVQKAIHEILKALTRLGGEQRAAGRAHLRVTVKFAILQPGFMNNFAGWPYALKCRTILRRPMGSAVPEVFQLHSAIRKPGDRGRAIAVITVQSAAQVVLDLFEFRPDDMKRRAKETIAMEFPLFKIALLNYAAFRIPLDRGGAFG